MTNNTPDYNDNLYFEEKMTNCKNCPYTDEYCASGDCNEIQAKDVACNKISLTSQSPRNGSQKGDLTSQWKKGELPEGIYYCNTGNTVETLFTWGKNYHQLTNNKDEVYIPEMDDCEIIAPVPSYDKWQLMQDDNKRLKHDVGNLGYKIKNQRHEIDNRLKEIEKLKELLKECRKEMRIAEIDFGCDYQELFDKIDEVLK